MTDLHLFNGDGAYAYVALYPNPSGTAWKVPASRRGGLFYDDARAIAAGSTPPTDSYPRVGILEPGRGQLVAVYDGRDDMVRTLTDDLNRVLATGAARTYLGNEADL